MTYKKFIKKIVEDGIKAAKRDYKRADQKAILKGSVAGFKDCLNKDVFGLSELLNKAQVKNQELFLRKPNPNKKELDKYWEVGGYTLEVEWVCNCVSALLMNEGKPTIITPTARGMIKASEIVGVRDK